MSPKSIRPVTVMRLRIDEHVVIIRVAVNHTASQTCLRLEPALQNEFAQARVFNQSGKLIHYAIAVREIPMKVTMHRRMIEVCECVVQLSELATEIVQQFRRVRSDLGQRHTRKIMDHANEVSRSVCSFRIASSSPDVAGKSV